MGKLLGNKIRELRKIKGFTALQLAEDSKISKSYIDLIERGLKEPSLTKIRDLADSLDSSVSELLFLQKEDKDVISAKYNNALNAREFEEKIVDILIKHFSTINWEREVMSHRLIWDLVLKNNNKSIYIDVKYIPANSYSNYSKSKVFEIFGRLISMCNIDNNIIYSIATNSRIFYDELIKYTPKLLLDNFNLQYILVENDEVTVKNLSS